MLSNTRLTGLLASCRIAILLIGVLGAFSALSYNDSNIRQTKPGLTFPNITYKDEQNRIHMLQQDAGRLTIVHFWATWCAPCVEELPSVNAIQSQYSANGLKVIDISEDGEHNVSAVKDFFSGHGIDALTPYVDIGHEGIRAAHIRGLPTTFFIDAGNHVFAFAEGPVNWKSKTTQDLITSHLQANK